MLSCVFFYSLVLLAVQWGPSQCQDIDAFVEDLKNRETYQTALEKNPDILDEVTNAMDTLGELWTIYMPELMEDTFSSSKYGISDGCLNSTASIVAWSIENNSTKMLIPLLDATGKPGAGLLEGNLVLVPSFDECFKYNYTSFCMGPVRLASSPKTSLFVWNVGLCVPKYCNSSDVAFVMNATKRFKVNSNLMMCTDVKTPAYSPGAIIMLVVCFLFVIFVAISTFLDWLVQKLSDVSKTEKTLQINNENNSSKSDAGERIPLLSHTVVQRSKGMKRLLNLATAFSLYKTIPTLFATKQAPSVISSLNGMRVISLFWVIMGHVHLAVFQGTGGSTNNALELKSMAARFSYQPLLNAFPAVDTFFFLSGVLVAYLTFRHMNRNGRFPFIHYYAHRYLRLTPVYAFVLFFFWLLQDHITTGPAFALAPTSSCAKYWWTNLLYINNFYPWHMRDQCMGWSWYLANDMQFYVISPLILIPLYFFLPAGLVVAGALLVCGFAITGSLVGVYNFQATIFVRFAYANYTTPDPSTDQNSMDLIYIKPYARISPYIVGILLGYVFYKRICIPFGQFVNKVVYLAMWVASGLILVPSLYGLYFIWHGHVLSKAENVLYMTFSRFSWGVGLAFIIFACHNGYGGLINTFLSLKMWTPLARMTYNAYLVHLIIIQIVYGQLQSAIHLTDITMAIYTVAIVVLSYAMAAVVCVCVEFPLGSIEMQIFEIVGLRGRVTQRSGPVAGKVEG